MDDLNSLLQRQVRKSFDRDFEDLPDSVRDFIKRVNRSYENFESDREMLERSLELTSDELVETNEELREALSEAEREAYYDSVTKLPNRNYFNEELEEVTGDPKNDDPIAVVFMDLDGFKELNDAYGHPFGDKVLYNLARRLEGYAEDNDLLARWGGDEFVLLVEEFGSRDKLKERLNELCEIFENSFVFENRTCHIKISMGVTIYPDDDEDPHDLLSKADMAMYEAKERPGNTFGFYTEGGVDQLKERINIKNDLRNAVRQDNLQVFYQPRVNTENHEVIGYEALARWEHPEEGFISPGKFIPVAESSGLIVELEKKIMAEVIDQVKEWGELYDRNRTISMNLSARHIQSDGLGERLHSLLSKNEINPELLELEITETGLLRNIESTREILQGLKESGVQVAVDDFGTGYSSLEYLMSLPIDTLKIDYSFVSNVVTDDFSRELVKMIHFVADELDLTVVAEGVETEEQLEIMKKYSDEIQGFLFAEPKPPSDVRTISTRQADTIGSTS